MKRKIPVLLLILIPVVFSCSSHQTPHLASITVTPSTRKTDSNITAKHKWLFVHGDSLKVAINNRFISVPKKSIEDYDSVYTGIYLIKNNSISQRFSIEINSIVYFTTFESVGKGYRGFLYAYDTEKKKLLGSFYASGGIFFLNKEYIFCVQYPQHENAEDPFYTLVLVYHIKGNKFQYLGFIKTTGEMTYDDSLIIKLYNKVTHYPRKKYLRR